MNDTINIMRDINRKLNELMLSAQIGDLVNRKRAIEITGLKPSTFAKYVCEGKIRIASTNATGTQFFSTKELIGL